ncbi:MAG: M48 family metallopeptidase [Beijerinckiaceae bacterium]
MESEAVYFDGLRPLPRRAQLALTGKGLNLSIDDGPAFLWHYGSIRLSDDSASPLRFHREESGSHTGEQLEIPAGEFTAALITRAPSLAGTAKERSQTLRRVIGWSMAAVVSIGLMIVYGIPALATRLAPLVPWQTEVSLGRAVEGQILLQLAGSDPRFCSADKTTEGARALQRMVDQLTAKAVLPGPVEVKVVDIAMENAFNLPGGKVLLLRGLIEKAQGPDEVAGVLAHELGHMAHRDAMRGLIHAGGVSFLIGTLLGDFTGAGALIIASKFLLGNRYSRENEAQADDFAIEIMSKAGGDVKALASFLNRVARSPGERQMALLLSHPVTADRVAAIERQAPVGVRQPLLTQREWAALQAICRKS